MTVLLHCEDPELPPDIDELDSDYVYIPMPDDDAE